MHVEQVMTTDIATCQPDTNLAVVATLMWHRDCGFVRSSMRRARWSGVITDRDICIASATRRLLPEQITAAQAMRRQPIHTTQPKDTAEKALATMKQFQVRRAAIVSTLAAICAHRPAKVAAA